MVVYIGLRCVAYVDRIMLPMTILFYKNFY